MSIFDILSLSLCATFVFSFTILYTNTGISSYLTPPTLTYFVPVWCYRVKAPVSYLTDLAMSVVPYVTTYYALHASFFLSDLRATVFHSLSGTVWCKCVSLPDESSHACKLFLVCCNFLCTTRPFFYLFNLIYFYFLVEALYLASHPLPSHPFHILSLLHTRLFPLPASFHFLISSLLLFWLVHLIKSWLFYLPHIFTRIFPPDKHTYTFPDFFVFFLLCLL